MFERHGDDLLLEVPVSFATAALGGMVEVPTLDGGAASLDVPSGTPGGKVLKLRNRGLPGLRGGRGDIVARIVIWVPPRMSGADRKKLEELGRSDAMRPPAPGKSLFERMRNAFAGT